MTRARGEILSGGISVYHCVSRCVRRAYLCGQDTVSGKNFDHRKGWLHERLVFLSRIFAIDVLGYALMSTHQHTLLRSRPDIVAGLKDEEVARRWLRLFPVSVDPEIHELAVTNLTYNKERIAELRNRLSSISWFMKSVNEYMARRANREDECKGRFWEGRFWCQRLEDESAVFACAVYVDLNPVRAKVASTPEESEFTSAFERIRALRLNKRDDTLWLAPINRIESGRGFLSVTLPEYLRILDETGRMIVSGKRGAIPESLAPILQRIQIRPEAWEDTISNFGRWFSRIVGRSDSMDAARLSLNRSWIKGAKAAEVAFAA